jgi:hypothetical protein
MSGDQETRAEPGQNRIGSEQLGLLCTFNRPVIYDHKVILHYLGYLPLLLVNVKKNCTSLISFLLPIPFADVYRTCPYVIWVYPNSWLAAVPSPSRIMDIEQISQDQLEGYTYWKSRLLEH